MSRSTTHTHRGHCQVCGGIHAIVPRTGVLARHGYTVDCGYFRGVCPGSWRRSLNDERSFCDEVRAGLVAHAEAQERLAQQYWSGDRHPPSVKSDVAQFVTVEGGKRHAVYPEISWDAASDYLRKYEVRNRTLALHADARRSRDHARTLGELADKVHGTEHFPAARRAPVSVNTNTSFMSSGGTTYIVQRLVRLESTRSGRPNYAVCMRQDGGAEETLSIAKVRNFIRQKLKTGHAAASERELAP